MDMLYTVKDLTELLRVSRSRLYELITEGLKPSLYLGSSPRWTTETISAFLAKQPTCRGGQVPTIEDESCRTTKNRDVFAAQRTTANGGAL